MSFLPYIIPSYALGLLIPAWFGLAALLRMRRADRRLAQIDPRRAHRGAGDPLRARRGGDE